MKRSFLLGIFFTLLVVESYAQSSPEIIRDRVINLVKPDKIDDPLLHEAKEYRASERITLHPPSTDDEGYSTTISPGQRISHIIDPTVVGGSTVPDGGGEPVTDNEWDAGIDKTLPVGYTPGIHSVTPTGGASYSIPLTLAAGTKGMVPEITLAYNSQSIGGVAGMGWSISGISSISRIGKSIDPDGERSPVTCETDRYALDGNRLVFKDIDNNESYYEGENRLFAEIIRNASSGIFTVQYRNGMKYTYGGTADSRVLCGNDNTLQWLLSKVEDLDGNYMTYHYNTDPEEKFLSQIKYTGNGSMQPYNTVTFYYQDRLDKREYYVAGKKFTKNVLLDKVVVSSVGKHFRSYKLEYFEKGYSYLKKVTEILPDGKELNPTIFNYGNTFARPPILNPDGFTGSEIGSDYDADWVFYPGDFNGDGLTDYLALHMSTFFKEQFIPIGQQVEMGRYDEWGILYKNIIGFSYHKITDNAELALAGGGGI